MRHLLNPFTRFGRQRLLSAACAVAVLGIASASASADSVTIANPVAVPATVNLSSGGDDWAHYASANPPSTGVVSSTFDHPATTGFSALLGINGSLEAYDVTSGAPVMTWTGGTPDVTGSSHSWEFNTNNYAESGETLGYTVAPGTDLINLYVDAYNGGSPTPLGVEVQAFLSSGPGATNTANLPVFWSAGADEDGDYAITVVNASASDETLTLNYLQTASQNGTGGNGSNVGIFGVTAASVVPEPGILGVAAMCGLAMLRRSRRK